MMRNEALALLKEYVKGDNMLTPCLADLAVKAMQRISGDWGL